MGIRVLMLNPKAIKMFLRSPAEWERRGRPSPLVRVDGHSRGVKLYDAITGTYIGGGHLSGDRRNPNGGDYEDANTSEGVRPQGVGYGLALYSGLALMAENNGSEGVSSPDGGGAADLWQQMVDSGLAEGEGDDSEGEDHEESTEVEVEVSLPSQGYSRRNSDYTDMIHSIRDNLDIPDEVKDEDIEVDLDSSVAEVPVTVRWKTKVEGGFFLPASQVHDADFVIGSFSTQDEVKGYMKSQRGKVPPDLVAAMPIPDAKALRNVIALLQGLGHNVAIEKMLERDDVRRFLQYEGKQMMVPGVPAHYPRPAGWKASQVPLPGMSGLGGKRGLGSVPQGLALSAAAQRVLHRFGEIG